MERFRLDTLARRVRDTFRAGAGRYGLDPRAVEARYILNWGGFVNASFVIEDGRQSYHLKLADDEWSQDNLRRWQALGERLTRLYRAPRILDWVEIPRTPFAGLLFEFIPGRPVDWDARPDLRPELLALLAGLHADQELAAAIADLDEQPVGSDTCGDYFISVYIDRFDEDLQAAAGDLPPFVSLDLLDWMMGETRELEGLARDLPAFQQPAVSPVHGDLWASNVLVTDSGAWYVIDWDDLALGDPALDYSIVLGPLWRAGRLTSEQAAALLPPGDPALRERFAVCQRALLLDGVIDSLADWVEVQFAPQHLEAVRAEKERVHRESLERYRALYA